MEWTNNNVKVKIDERVVWEINCVQINIEIRLKNALDNIPKAFVVVLVDEATGNITLVCKRFYASVITRELTLNNNSSTDIYNNTDGLSANDIIDKNMRNWKLNLVLTTFLLKIINCLICTGCLRCIKSLLKLDSL